VCDEETLVAHFRFSATGAYKGMPYCFGPDVGCGFCHDGSVPSTITVENGRTQGGV